MMIKRTDTPAKEQTFEASSPYLTLADGLIALGVMMVVLLVYLLTLTPSLSYLSPDGSELATVPYVLGLAHSPGYPLYTWLGFLFSRLLPFGDVAHRMNLLSAVLGALGVGGLFLILRLLLPLPDRVKPLGDHTSSEKRSLGTARSVAISLWFARIIAALSALLFAFSRDFWSQALIAEVYAPNIGLVSLTLLTLLLWERSQRARTFFLFALLFGLSLGTHLSNLGFAPALAFFVLLTFLAPIAASLKGLSAVPDGGFWTRSRVTMALRSALSPNDPHAVPGRGQHPLSTRFAQALLSLLAGALGFALGVAQFLWLPLRAGTLNDRMMLRNAPTTLAGMYRYTLGAFPQFKFAFPLAAIPDRLVVYLDLLRQQYWLPGIALGILGLVVLLFLRPRHFHLFTGMYLVNVWFFIQYRAFDLEVFFIPAHFIWAMYIGFGIWGIYLGLLALKRHWKPLGSQAEILAGLLLSVLLLGLVVLPLKRNWQHNDLSDDTAINDFYANAWELLPSDTVLLTPGGVFGYDAFYWQLVYGTRPDVTLPALPGPNPSPEELSGRQVYATLRALSGQRGPGALPPDLLRGDLWAIPFLVGEQPAGLSGQRQPLLILALSDQPPELVVEDLQPEVSLRADLGAAVLVGADVTPTMVESGAVIQLALYWQLQSPQRLRVEIALGDQILEQHEVGFGLLERYQREVGLQVGDVIVERYYLVIPSTQEVGNVPLRLRSVGLGGSRGNQVSIGYLQIVDQEGTMERWLTIAQQ